MDVDVLCEKVDVLFEIVEEYLERATDAEAEGKYSLAHILLVEALKYELIIARLTDWP